MRTTFSGLTRLSDILDSAVQEDTPYRAEGTDTPTMPIRHFIIPLLPIPVTASATSKKLPRLSRHELRRGLLLLHPENLEIRVLRPD
jgi:hypothetical protein